MPDRASLVSNLREFCSGAPKKIAILKAVRKLKSYKEVAKEVQAAEDYCSTVPNAAQANELVEGNRGFYRQTPQMRTINIDSELKKKTTKKTHPIPAPKPMEEKVRILHLEKPLDELNIDPVIRKDCFPLRKP